MNKSQNPVPDNQVRLRYIQNTTQLLNQLTELDLSLLTFWIRSESLI